uniref:Haloacid dehalogenase-like hydrolase n=1 Tax=Candidatus Kentrum sp. LPFa TaxID=2126335 RepID=A0A450W3Z6_9GAMM|nr:MAG: Haloacid dehalogenase-like hydrolase [Candidatus Kentron sp. LPFa]
MIYKLRTVDVWDTLIRRTCNPETVKLATALHVFLRFPHSLGVGLSNHWHLYEKRIEIERIMAREAEATGYDGEYEFIAVFRRWLETILRYPLSQDLDGIAKEIAENELRFEIINTFPDDGIIDFLASHPAEKTLYLSDFYMTSAMVDRILAHHGLNTLFPQGVVSCDVMLNKRSGRLFKYIQQMQNVGSNEHIHIGDNEYSDVEIPRQLGVTAIHYLPEADHRARIERDALFSSRDVLFTHMAESARQAAGSLGNRNDDAKAAFQLGLQAAPLFIGYMLFIAERSVIDNVEKLYFFTREGEFFYRLFDVLFPDGKYVGHDLPPRIVLAVSRYATLAASLNAVTLDEFNRIFTIGWQQRFSTLFEILGIDPCDFQPLLRRLNLSLEEIILYPQNDPRIAELLDDPAFSSAVSANLAKKKVLIRRYLEQQGYVPGKKVGVVDIGWRGSIQDNLARIAPECKTVGYYIGLWSYIVDHQLPNTIKHAFGLDRRYEQYPKSFEAYQPLELLCNSPNGSVVGYRNKDGMVFPLREINEEENAIFNDFILQFQNGVVYATKLQGPLLMSHAVMSQEMRDMGLSIWEKIVSRPIEQLVKAYCATPEHDVFGYGDYFKRGQAPSITHILAAIVSNRRRHEVIQYIRRTQWTEALHGLSIGRFHKFILVCIFFLAHQYRRRIILRKKAANRVVKKSQ